MAKPLLKWAGGKRQIISQLDKNLPLALKQGQIQQYAEPFIGGGALLFHLFENYPINKAYISDINTHLIRMYQIVKSDPQGLCAELSVLSDRYFSSDSANKEKMFYQIRENFNTQQISFLYQAAALIFLNRTCFNGLYRVNSKGNFNTPFGKYKKPLIYDEDNILSCSKILQNVDIVAAEYHQIPQKYLTDAFVYFDPPYRPLSATASFASYTKSGFNDDNQTQLAKYFSQISQNDNLYLMLSNSDPKNSCRMDDFFDILYQEFSIQRISASRAINSNSTGRGKINELLIKNY